jgi:hypothetical protein
MSLTLVKVRGYRFCTKALCFAYTACFNRFVLLSQYAAGLSPNSSNERVLINGTKCVYCAVRAEFLYMSPHSSNERILINGTKCVYCAVRAEFLYINYANFSLKRFNAVRFKEFKYHWNRLLKPNKVIIPISG